MDKVGRLAKAIRKQKKSNGYVYGIWTGAEVIDSDLSQVFIPGAGLDGRGETHRFVPRGAHVTGLTNPSLVLCMGNPLCIIARVVGDAFLAES